MVANTWRVWNYNLTPSPGYVEIPVPTTWTWSYYDLSSDDSGRSLDGKMHKDIVAVKRKHECTWQNVTADVAQAIMNPFKEFVFTNIQFYDVYAGGYTDVRVYTGDVTATARNAYGQTVFDISMNFIQQ